MPFAYINLQMRLLSYKNRRSTEHRILECALQEKLFIIRRKRAWTVSILMPVIGISIEQCCQTVILLFKGSWGRWWRLLEALVYLPGQTKGAEIKAFPFILPTSWIFIKLATVFEHNLLPCSLGMCKKTPLAHNQEPNLPVQVQEEYTGSYTG